MIGYLEGKIIFSDGNETILLTQSGVGHQVVTFEILPEDQITGLFVSHIVKETSEELFGFRTLKEKKAFELLLKVKGVGPKSAFKLVHALGVQGLLQSIAYEDKKTLQKAPGVGAKAAAQIILDLSSKINQLQMYSNNYSVQVTGIDEIGEVVIEKSAVETQTFSGQTDLVEEALMACKELGFKEDKILPIANKILNETALSKPEQLVHLVLKEL